MSTAPKRRWFLFACASGILVLCALIAATTLYRGWTVAALERHIQAEVPSECDRATAGGWLAYHGIKVTWFDDTTGDRRGQRTMPQLAGLQDIEPSGMLRGDIAEEEVNAGLMRSGSISVYFFFDTKGRMVGHLVHETIYSL